jgi:ABC-type multidrug transport system ATPase subunit
MALFLDEPTSELDASSASAVMRTLKAISRIGITIVTIIHQPRRETFESLDNLLLLGAGKIIYQGSQDHVEPYFEQLGFEFPLIVILQMLLVIPQLGKVTFINALDIQISITWSHSGVTEAKILWNLT